MLIILGLKSQNEKFQGVPPIFSIFFPYQFPPEVLRFPISWQFVIYLRHFSKLGLYLTLFLSSKTNSSSWAWCESLLVTKEHHSTSLYSLTLLQGRIELDYGPRLLPFHWRFSNIKIWCLDFLNVLHFYA